MTRIIQIAINLFV